MKCAKVVVFYFGNRRLGSNNVPTSTLVPEIVQKEIDIDKGIDTDTIFVVNKTDTPADDQLDQYHNQSTKNGKMIVHKRANVGLSFGGYLDAFSTFRYQYDYWFFVEDDVIVYKPEYVKAFVEELEDTDATFIALSPVSDYVSTHCGGGCGLTSTSYMNAAYPEQKLESVLRKWAGFSGYDVAANRLGRENAEVEFTSYFKLANHSKFSPICDNYKKGHTSQAKHAHKYNLDTLEFIYKVGN
jgi:hypothetical protein